MSDVQLISSLLSRKRIAKPLRHAARQVDEAILHKAICDLLRKPRRKWFAQEQLADCWGAAAADDSDAAAPNSLVQLAREIKSSSSAARKASRRFGHKVLQRYSERIEQLDLIQCPMEVLACANLWLALLPQLDAGIALKALRLLFHAAELTQADEGTATDDSASPPPDVDRLIADFEVPWTLAVLLGPILSRSRAVKAATKQFSRSLLASTDLDGLPAACLARRMSDWLRLLNRVSRWGELFDVTPWTKSGRKRFDEAIRQVAILMAPDGEFVLEENLPADAGLVGSRLLSEAGRKTGFGKRHAITTYIESVIADAERSSHKKRRKKKKASAATKRGSSWDDTPASNYSDWSEIAILRSSLDRHGDMIGVAFEQSEILLTMHALGTPLLRGAWTISCSTATETCAGPEQWNCASWFDDDEVTYVEFESSPMDGLSYCRQILLSKDDQYAILCDSVHASERNVVELKSTLPLVSSMAVETDRETRQLILSGDWQRARVIPMWLQDSRFQATDGHLTGDDGVLQLSAAGSGGITMPLLLDWNPDRIAAEVDWRQLTVTEDRRLLTPSDAAGFRARVGDLNLLVFRSLQQGAEMRAVLGLHTGSETVFARIDKEGEVEPLVLVDAN